MLPRLFRIERIGMDVGVGELRTLEKRIYAEIIIVHQLTIQPVEIEQVLHRKTEISILENGVLQIHLQTVESLRQIQKYARTADPAALNGGKIISLVPFLRSPLFHQVQFAQPQEIERAFGRNDPEIDLVEIELPDEIALLVAPPVRDALECQ